MTQGRLIAIVGPSGVGKDSVMAGIVTADPSVQLVRRTITRASELGGEDYDAMTPDAFLKAANKGAFCVHWQAHELHYGIPAQVLRDVNAGATALANLSRSALSDAAAIFPQLCVLNLTAKPETLAARLASRGREGSAEIGRRLSRVVAPFPETLNVTDIANDGPIEQTVTAALAAIYPVRA